MLSLYEDARLTQRAQHDIFVIKLLWRRASTYPHDGLSAFRPWAATAAT